VKTLLKRKISLVKKIKNKKTIFSALLAGLLVLIVFYAWPGKSIAPLKSNSASEASRPPSGQQPAFDKTKYPTGTASSIWVVVNKGRALPPDYVPADLVVPSTPLRLSSSASEMHLRQDAASALKMMFSAAESQGLKLMLASGYRSYSDQISVYSNYVAQSGAAQADTFSARAGHSEHQTGLAADIEPLSRACEVEQCFEDTPEGVWLAANSYKYGFVIRYQKDAQNLTGYEYEPWHVRYVGNDLALQLWQSGQTMEQYFSLPVYTSYPVQQLQLKDN
jgi:zinc D-Ala-D-Ala carboxypeptidase